jgi:hypothetical protein
METIESLSERLEALEHQTRAAERRLHRWRRIAYGLLIVGLVTLPLASGTAQDESSEYRGIRKRLAALEYKLVHVTGGVDEVIISGANLRIVNGLGETLTKNGLGNLIVGYNESRTPFGGTDERTGSHNVVVGSLHNFIGSGGLVVGRTNDISGDFASVSGGLVNIASGFASSVSGGSGNDASNNSSSVSGGLQNTATGDFASVSGGDLNTASGRVSSVSGGFQRTAPQNNNWAAGPLFAAQ